MVHAGTVRELLFLIAVVFLSIVLLPPVDAQDTRTYQYQGAGIDLEILENRLAVFYLDGGGAHVDLLEAVAEVQNLRLAAKEFYPKQEMAVLTLDPPPDRTCLAALRNRLSRIPGVRCVSHLYRSGSAACTTDDTVLACFSPGTSPADRALIAGCASARIVKEFPGIEGWVQLRCSNPAELDAFDVSDTLLTDSRIRHAHPDFIHFVEKCAVPNDTHFSKQWALNKIDAPEGWDLHTGNADIVIAVLDDGVDTQHEDLAAKITRPYDATDGNTSQEPNAWDGHGTACAGIAAAVTSNGKGVAGVSWKSKIMPIRIGYSLQATPGTLVTKSEWLGLGILMASLQGADVLSNSWGGMTPTDFVTVAIQNARTTGRGGKGCTLVFPTGNGDKQGVQYPATLTEVIAVGATDETDSRVTGGSWGSNYGSEIDVVAPGINLWTTDISGTAAGYNKGASYDPAGNYHNAFSGTSAAVPHVAGLAALILARDPGLSPAAVQDVIQKSADDVGPAGKDIYTGYGRINANKALQEVRFIPVSGTLTQDTTWTSGHVYLISNSLTVASTVTLTIEADVVVKFKYNSGTLTVQGDLKLLGTPGHEVVFTSERDDTYGGDTNGDGGATKPNPGDWRYIYIYKATTVLQNAIFRYGNWNANAGMVYVIDCSPDITACTFEHSQGPAIYYRGDPTRAFTLSNSTFNTCPTAMTFSIVNAASQVKGNTITGSTGYPIRLLDGTTPVLDPTNTITLSKNTVIAASGTLNRNTTWPKVMFGTTEMPYLVEGGFTVDAGSTLTIEAEVVVKFRYNTSTMVVLGDLALQGSPGKEVVFTSERDDLNGGDSNGDGTATKPAPGDWRYIQIYKTTTTLHDALFLYGGQHASYGMVFVYNCSPDITACTFAGTSSIGLYYQADATRAFTLSNNTFHTCPTAMAFSTVNAASQVRGNTITGSTGYPIRLLDGTRPVLDAGNTITLSKNTVIAASGTLNRNTTWPKVMFGTTEMPYLVEGALTVDAGSTLTIEAEVVVKFRYNTSTMIVQGDLSLQGSAGKEVVFTSERDDLHGGDSNGDGTATSPAAGDWRYIQIQKSTTALHDALFLYGGQNTSYGMVFLYNCSPDIAACTFADTLSIGLHYQADPTKTFTLSNSTFNTCPTAMAFTAVNAASQVKGNTITGSTGYPIRLLDGTPPVLDPTNTINTTKNTVIAASGTMNRNTTWPKMLFGATEMPYLVEGGLTVDASSTLTIDAEVVVKFRYYTSTMVVQGDLSLQGSAGKEVVFTSERDDAHGGDSNGDGTATRPAAGDWRYIQIQKSTTALHDALFLYGGQHASYGMVFVYNCSPDITACTFAVASTMALCYQADPMTAFTLSNNTFHTCPTAMAFTAVNAASQVKGNTITGSTGYPIRLLDGTPPVLDPTNTITLSKNTVIAASGTMNRNTTWPKVLFGATEMPFLVEGGLTVDVSSALTIDAEVVVKFKHYTSTMIVQGHLALQGSAGKEVVFTSERDDAHGGDSNGDGTATRPAAGDWRYVQIHKTTSALHDALFLYGGQNTSYGMVFVYNCSPDITACTFENALSIGLYYQADPLITFTLSNNTFTSCPTAVTLLDPHPASVVSGNTFSGSTSYPIHLVNGVMVVFQNNTFAGTGHKVVALSGTLRNDLTLTGIPFGGKAVPFLINGTLTVATGFTLTIDPGVVVKFRLSSGTLAVQGDLKLKGAQGSPIVFTSERDDDHGGDSNGDGRNTLPAKGNWRSIILYNSRTRFENALLRFGGYGSSSGYGMLSVNSCSAEVRNCRFEKSSSRALYYTPDPNRVTFPLVENIQVLDCSSGIEVADSAMTIANLTLRNCHVNTDSGDGLVLRNQNARCTFEGMTIRGKGNGIRLYNSYPTIRNSILHNCGGYGILESDATSDPVLLNNCFHASVSGQYYDHDTTLAVNTAAEINALNPPASSSGNIVANPAFTAGPLGNYYLSQIAAGQVLDSPCLDAGHTLSRVNGTTRTDHVQDTGDPDIGYHHPLELDADEYSISVGKQSRVCMRLALGKENGHLPYMVLCGFSGSRPGTNLGGLQIPLNFDTITYSVIVLYGSPMFQDFSGTLDSNGTAAPVLDTLGPLPPSLKGMTLTIAAILPLTDASNPLAFRILD